jgi:hypothetical protein
MNKFPMFSFAAIAPRRRNRFHGARAEAVGFVGLNLERDHFRMKRSLH